VKFSGSEKESNKESRQEGKESKEEKVRTPDAKRGGPAVIIRRTALYFWPFSSPILAADPRFTSAKNSSNLFSSAERFSFMARVCLKKGRGKGGFLPNPVFSDKNAHALRVY
jgi:hypothetical protein